MTGDQIIDELRIVAERLEAKPSDQVAKVEAVVACVRLAQAADTSALADDEVWMQVPHAVRQIMLAGFCLAIAHSVELK